MAATHQPIGGEFSHSDSWQSLVRDQRYRLFAAGNRRAAIAEYLPAPMPAAKGGEALAAARSFDARYGLAADGANGLVLLTQVCRVAEAMPQNGARGEAGAKRQVWRWEATRLVRPIAHLKTYLDEQTGSFVFFLTRSAEPREARAAGRRERIVDSAVRIGRSLGMDEENLEALRVAGVVHGMGKLAPPQEAGEKFFVTAEEARESGRQCQSPDCESPARVRLLDEAYCGNHFIAACYERLDWCAERLGQRNAVETETGEMQSFLRACIEQAAALTRNPFHQEALERARLLDILYTAGDLLRRMRRSPRREEAIQVRLSCDTPGRPWEERVSTKLISRHGAMLECEHLVKADDWLTVERLDTGRKARARMAWRGPMRGRHFSVAVEFVDEQNFWELSWGDRAAGSANSAAARAAGR
jgi:hypothetical protein